MEYTHYLLDQYTDKRGKFGPEKEDMVEFTLREVIPELRKVLRRDMRATIWLVFIELPEVIKRQNILDLWECQLKLWAERLPRSVRSMLLPESIRVFEDLYADYRAAGPSRLRTTPEAHYLFFRAQLLYHMLVSVRSMTNVGPQDIKFEEINSDYEVIGVRTFHVSEARVRCLWKALPYWYPYAVDYEWIVVKGRWEQCFGVVQRLTDEQLAFLVDLARRDSVAEPEKDPSSSERATLNRRNVTNVEL